MLTPESSSKSLGGAQIRLISLVWRSGRMSKNYVSGVIKERYTSSRSLHPAHRTYSCLHSSAYHSYLKRNRQSTLSPLTNFIPLPKYFESEWSYAQYRIPAQSSHISLSATQNKQSPTADVPDEERCVVGWIEGPSSDTSVTGNEYQLIALTYTGGWYRLSLPAFGNSAVSPAAPFLSGSPPRQSSITRQRAGSGGSTTSRDKGKEKEKDSKEKRDCVLQEFRRYGRWDGWG